MDPATAKARLDEVKRLRQAGRLEAARAAAEAIAKQLPDYHAAICALAGIYLEMRDLPRALLHGARALMLAPGDVSTLLVLAGVYLASDALDLAEETLDKLLVLAPDDVSVLVMLGELHRRKDRFVQARDCFDGALTRSPSDQAAAIGLAQCLSRLGDLPGTAKLLVDLLRQTPVSTEVLTLAGELPQWPHATDLLGLLERVRIPAGDVQAQVMLGLSKARALDRAGLPEDAWKQVGMSRQLARPQVEAAAMQRRQREAALLSDTRGRRVAPVEGSKDQAPISLLVVGPSRSGKSTLERLIGSLDDVRLGFENRLVEEAVVQAMVEAELPRVSRLNLLPAALDRQFRRHYLERAAALAQGVRVLTNSHPARGYDVARIAGSVPGTRLVLMKRNVDDLVVRMLMHPRLTDIALDEPTVRAHIAWYFDMLDLLAEKFPAISLMTSYEEMLEEPGKLRNAVASLCGVPDPGGPLPQLGDDRECSIGYRSLLSG